MPKFIFLPAGREIIHRLCLKAAKTKSIDDLIPSFERASLNKRAREEQLKIAVDYALRPKKAVSISEEFES